MSKTILIEGNSQNSKIISYIEKEVNFFLQKDISYNDYFKFQNMYQLNSIDDKISTEEINLYIDFINSSSIEGDKKVAIINKFDLLSINNQNKLLKTIEENRENTLQIFIAENTTNIIPTILSRVLAIKLKEENITNDLTIEENKYLEDEDLTNTFEIYKNHIENSNISEAYLLITTKFKQINLLLANIIIKTTFNVLYDLKKYEVIKKLLDYEKKISSNQNISLQISSFLIELEKEVKNGN